MKLRQKRQECIEETRVGALSMATHYDVEGGPEPESPISTTLPERHPRAIITTVDAVDGDAKDDMAETEGR